MPEGAAILTANIIRVIVCKEGDIMGNLADFKEVLYHTGLSTAMIEKAEYAILPGDPGRVEVLAKAFGEAEFIASHRE